MSAEQITLDEIVRLRGRILAGGRYAWRTSECLAILDALESSRAEVQRLTEEARVLKNSLPLPPRASMERVNHIVESELGYPDGTEIYHVRFRAFRTGFVRGQDYMQACAHDRLATRCSPSPQPATGAWIDLPAGCLTQEGDEMEASNDPWREEPKWVPAPAGLSVPDPAYPAHTRFRRPSPHPSADVVQVPRELMERLHDFVADSPNMMAGMQLQAEIGDALRSSTNHDAQDAGEGR